MLLRNAPDNISTETYRYKQTRHVLAVSEVLYFLQNIICQNEKYISFLLCIQKILKH